MIRLRHVANLVRGAGFPIDRQGIDDNALPFFKVGDLSEATDRTWLHGCANWISKATALELGARAVPPSSVLMPKIGAALYGGVRRLTTQWSVFDNNVIGIVPRAIEPRYLRYWLTTINIRMMDNPGPVPSLDDRRLLDERVPVVDLGLQVAIADYLDRETARTDTLIDKKQRLIDLTAEARRAFLAEAFETGLTPTIPLMHIVDPSAPIMYGIVLPGPDVPEGVMLVKGGQVHAERLAPELLSRTSFAVEAPFARSRLRGGDVLLSIRGGIGSVAIVPDSLGGANITQDLARIRPRSGVLSLWLALALETPDVQAQIESQVLGATVRGINIRDVKRLRVPAMTSVHQSVLVERMSGVLHAMERSSLHIRRSITLLQERRHSLIAGAVTGQLSIPEAA